MTKERLQLKGVYRIHIINPDTGEIVGDSGWMENMITNDGFRYYMVQMMAGLSGSTRVTHVAIGKGTAPASDETSALQSEHEVRKGVFTSDNTITEIASKTIQFLATFGSSDNFITDSTGQPIQNIGLFNSSNKTSAGQYILAGNTYTQSTCATNQNVNVTYQLRFSTV